MNIRSHGRPAREQACAHDVDHHNVWVYGSRM